MVSTLAQFVLKNPHRLQIRPRGPIRWSQGYQIKRSQRRQSCLLVHSGAAGMGLLSYRAFYFIFAVLSVLNRVTQADI